MSNILNDSKILLFHSKFLFDRGFVILSKEEYSIRLAKKEVKIDLFYERSENSSDVLIRFSPDNKVYSVGWILTIFSDENNIQCTLDNNNKLNNILAILEFIKENYDNVISQSYCEDMINKVEMFILKMSNKQKQRNNHSAHSLVLLRW